MNIFRFKIAFISVILLMTGSSHAQSESNEVEEKFAIIAGQFEFNELIPFTKMNLQVEEGETNTALLDVEIDTGDFVLKLPLKMKYKYFLTPSGSDVTHYAVIKIPTAKKRLLFLLQKINFFRDDNGEITASIHNSFQKKKYQRKAKRKVKKLWPELLKN